MMPCRGLFGVLKNKFHNQFKLNQIGLHNQIIYSFIAK